MGDVMDFLGASTPNPFQKLAFNATWLNSIENDLRLRFECQQSEIRILRDDNAVRLHNPHRPSSTTHAIAGSIRTDAPTTPVVTPREQEEEWEEVEEQPEEDLVLLA